jgi:RNA polymerase sigma-70 factor (ECF subfamily)
MEAPGPELPGLLTSPETFAAFYTEMLPRVYGYLYHRSAGPAAAEDLTQETFLAAVAEIKKGKVVTDPANWIMGIARHKWLDQLRKGMRDERRLALVWQAEQLSDQDARLAWEGESSRERALAALGSVPDNQRGVLSLRYLDGYSVPEIARMIGRSVHATESILARGRENFKRSYARSRP